jgi:formylglycine-generating enzyme required for sulfatase activity
MVFCYIPAGEFWMGSPEDEVDRSNDESLHRVVFTEAFWLGKYQVTQLQWEAVVGGCPYESGWIFLGPQNPAECVNWEDCQDFIQELNTRNDGNVYGLPTEAQWEYACRAGTTTPFSFGVTITPEQVNYNGEAIYPNMADGLYREKTIPVGSLNQPNQWGLHDMHGNVSEWCADWYDKNYYKNCLTNDPKGPEIGKYRVLRGGNWMHYANLCRSAYRETGSPASRFHTNGFRVVVHSSIT